MSQLQALFSPSQLAAMELVREFINQQVLAEQAKKNSAGA